jgi:NAD(P)-dependent dehydrogenase (short-subunit alcohol dehydrogenase family)
MKIKGSIALVTGANRGLGLAFAKALVEMGAAKVYAAARNPEAVTLKGVVPLKLDVTSDEDAVYDDLIPHLVSAGRTSIAAVMQTRSRTVEMPSGAWRPLPSSNTQR